MMAGGGDILTLICGEGQKVGDRLVVFTNNLVIHHLKRSDKQQHIELMNSHPCQDLG